MRFSTGLSRATLALAILPAMLVASLAAIRPASAEGKRTLQRRELAPGVVYKAIHDTAGPWRIFVVSIDASKPSTMDVALGRERLKGVERTSSIARRRKALAAINGDYPQPSGRPVHTYVEDGRLLQRESVYGRNFSIDRSEERAYIGHPQVSRSLKLPNETNTAIDLINLSRPKRNQIGEYGPESKGVADPPERACSIRLQPQRTPYFATKKAVSRDYQVSASRCARTSMHRGDGLVVAARTGERRALLRQIEAGEQVALRWSIGRPRILDSIGGNPNILIDGRIPRESTVGCGSFCGRHPRTGVGWTEDGRVLLVVVDGRSKKSAGMTLYEFANLFRSLGADDALNVDGGGSSTMWIRGLGVVNVPSDGNERPVSSALMVLSGADPNERVSNARPSPTPDPDPSPEPSPGPIPSLPPLPPSYDSAWDRAAADPASTGGLADSLRRKGRPVPRSLREALRIFDEAR